MDLWMDYFDCQLISIKGKIILEKCPKVVYGFQNPTVLSLLS